MASYYQAAHDAAFAALAPELGASDANKTVAAQRESLPRVKTSLSQAGIKQLEEVVGMPFIVEHTKACTSDHPILVAEREILDGIFDKTMKVKTMKTPHVHMGASAHEVLGNWTNKAAHFHLHNSEAKDATRTNSVVLEDMLARLSEFAAEDCSVPVSTVPANKKKATIVFKETRELLEAFETMANGGEKVEERRIHLQSVPKTHTLLYRDSGYNNTELDWFAVFAESSAQVAHVRGFYPSQILFPDMVESPFYNFERRFPSRGQEWMHALSVLPAIGAYHSAIMGNAAWCGTFVKAFCAMWKIATALRGTRPITDELLVSYGLANAAEILHGADVNIAGVGSLQKGLRDFMAISASRIALGWFDEKMEVTYKGGYQNGYSHSARAWGCLFSGPVLTNPLMDFVLHVEIKQRVGDMYWFTLTRASPFQTIVRTISLPQNLRYVRILDIPASFDLLTGRMKSSGLVYFSALEREFYDTANYLGSQKPESLTLPATNTLVQRASGGLQVATTEYAPKWTLPKSHFWRFALACTMHAVQQNQDSAEFAGAIRQYAGKFDSRFQQVLRRVLEVAVHTVTFGLAAPACQLYAWLFSKTRTIEFMIPGVCEVTQRYEPSASTFAALAGQMLLPKGPEHPISVDFDVNVDKKDQVHLECHFRQLVGDQGLQKIKCLHRPGEHVKKTRVEYSMQEINELRAAMAVSRDQATAELRDVIDRAIGELPAVPISFEIETELIIGGPGVGKSKVARHYIEMLDKKERLSTMVHAPFKKLQPDYPPVPAPGEYAFKFFTTHKGLGQSGYGVSVIDEYTAMDERIGLIAAYLCGAKKIVFIGDEKQTGVRPEEGQRFFAPGSKLRLGDFHTHILTTFFRGDMWVAAWCNYKHDYHMWAADDTIKVPKIKPLAEAGRTGRPVMSFSNATGLESGLVEPNNVRMNQGGTMDNGVDIAIKERDIPLLENSALQIVAFTRHRKGTELTFFVDDGPAKTSLELQLCLNDPAFMDNIAMLARPDIDAYYGADVMSRGNGEFGKFMSAMHADGIVTFDGEKETEIALQRKREYEEVVVALSEITDARALLDLEMGVEIPLTEQEALDEYVEVVEMVNEELSFEDSLGFKWCTLEAALGSTPNEYFEPVTAADMAGYKEYVVAACPNPKNEGVPLAVFMNYMDSQNLGYVIAECTPHAKGIYQKTHYSGRQRMAAIMVFNGHATAISKRKLDDFLKFEKEKIKSSWTKSVQIRGVDTIESLNRRYVDVTFDLETPDKSLSVAVLKSRNTFGRLIAAPSQKVGGHPVAGDQVVYVEATHSNMNDYANVLRSFVPVAHKRDYVAAAPLPKVDHSMSHDAGFGYDAFRLHHLARGHLSPIGPSRLNAIGAALTPICKMKVKVNLAQFMLPVNARGNPQPMSKKAYAFNITDGLVQTASVSEIIASMMRYTRVEPSKRFSIEGARVARQMVARNLWKNYDLSEGFSDPILESGIDAKFGLDARARNYDGRAEALATTMSNPFQATYTVKEQAKIRKGGAIKETKIGQGISAASPETNLLFGSMFRILGTRMKLRAKKHNIFDCFAAEESVKAQFNEQFERLGSYKESVIADAIEYDSKQDWFSRYCEALFWIELSRLDAHVNAYMEWVRAKYRMTVFGLVTAMVYGPKPSGAPDTLSGNTLTEETFMTWFLDTLSEYLQLKKGDDFLMFCQRYVFRNDREVQLRAFTKLRMVVERGSKEFCGKVVSSEGMFENISRKTRRALGYKFTKYSEFAEYQKSIRESVAKIRHEGLEKAISATSQACGISCHEVMTDFMILNSLGHISEEQLMEVVSEIEVFRPGPTGPNNSIKPFGL